MSVSDHLSTFASQLLSLLKVSPALPLASPLQPSCACPLWLPVPRLAAQRTALRSSRRGRMLHVRISRRSRRGTVNEKRRESSFVRRRLRPPRPRMQRRSRRPRLPGALPRQHRRLPQRLCQSSRQGLRHPLCQVPPRVRHRGHRLPRVRRLHPQVDSREMLRGRRGRRR